MRTGVSTSEQSTIVPSASSVVADGTSTITLTVTLMDVNSNLRGAGDAVTLSADAGTSSVIAVPETSTDASGVASFVVTNLFAEAVTYTASSAGASVAVTVTFTASAPTTIALSATPPVAGTQFTWTLSGGWGLDALGDSAHLAVADCSAEIPGELSTTLDSEDRGLSSTSGAFTVTTSGTYIVCYKLATDAASSAVPEQTVTVVPASADSVASSIDVAPASLVADGVETSTVTVTLRDNYSNLRLDGDFVTLTRSAGGSELTATATAGVAVFTVSQTLTGIIDFTATSEAASVATQITFLPGMLFDCAVIAICSFH